MNDNLRIIITVGIIGILSAIGGQYFSHIRHKKEEKQSSIQTNYVTIPGGIHDSHPSLEAIDFDGDGDQDLVLSRTQAKPGFSSTYETRLYFFRNDGKGNFDLVSQPPRGYEPERK